jgi:type I restriction enzyme, S subunit
MKDDSKRELKPNLRFPQFRDAEGWDETRFDEVLSPIVRERKKPNEAYTGLGLRSHGKGTFLKLLENPAKISMEHLYEVKCDDLVVNITFAWEGAVAIAEAHDDGALVSHRFPTYTFEKSKAIPAFFRYIILDKQFVYNLGVISPGGAGRNRVLNKNDFLKLSTFLPDINEQQKIADCLATLDELIAANRRKLDVLKAHQKGLMQQLFPREGEATPRLRFPEFRDESEWTVKNLSAIAENLDNKRVPITASGREKGTIPYYGASGVVDYVKDFLFDEELLCISEDGANLVARTYPIAFSISGKTWVNNHAHVLRFTNRATQTLVEKYLNSIDLTDFITGMAQPKLNKAMLDSIPVPLSSIAEQQRVASFLTSLDQLVVAQKQKIDTLNAHKKGLMQQLFPSPEEVEG